MINKKSILFTLIIIIAISAILFAADEPDKKVKKDKKADSDLIFGFIFNSNNILVDISDYQGGVGMKIKNLHFSGLTFDVRCSLGLTMNDGLDDFSIRTGLATEFHFMERGRLSPYWGLFINVDYIRSYNYIDENNWFDTVLIPFSTGGIFGIEVFVFEFLSFFAEYNLSVNFSHTSIESPAETETIFTYNLTTELGNATMIGIVIYFEPVVTIEKK